MQSVSELQSRFDQSVNRLEAQLTQFVSGLHSRFDQSVDRFEVQSMQLVSGLQSRFDQSMQTLTEQFSGLLGRVQVTEDVIKRLDRQGVLNMDNLKTLFEKVQRRKKNAVGAANGV